MKVRGGEFSTGTMGNFQPELTWIIKRHCPDHLLLDYCHYRFLYF